MNIQEAAKKARAGFAIQRRMWNENVKSPMWVIFSHTHGKYFTDTNTSYTLSEDDVQAYDWRIFR